MSKVSIIIPARGENNENIARTLQSIIDNATGDYEVIIGFNGGSIDGSWPYMQELEDSGKLQIIDFPRNIGIKGNINALAATATGKYIYKSDAHCSFGKGFDEILQENMQDDWIVMPRFKIIKDDWSIQMRDGEEEFYDYFYLCCPFTDSKGFRFKAGGHWPERTKERLTSHPDIDETPQIHGSGWFMHKDRFFELGGFPITDPYGHGMEPIHLALRNYLKGGKVMVNKKTFYAHLHQNSNERGYPEDKSHTERTYKLVAEHYLGDEEPNMIHKFEWFINEKFPGMPGWDNWEEYYQLWKEQNGKS